MNNMTIKETCCVFGCKERSCWHPVIKAWAKGYDKRTSVPLECEVGMGFCAMHKGTFKPEDIPDIKTIVINVARAYKVVEPDTETMEVEMRPIVLHDQSGAKT